MNSSHIVRAYDDDLARLGARIAAMGGQAERLIEQAVSALVNSDLTLARHVIEADQALDRAHREIDDTAVTLIARRQPMAGDLREILSAIRISAELERVGDMGKNIGKRVAAVAETRQPPRLFRGLEALANLALTQLKEALDVYATRSVGQVSSIRDRDEEIDAIYTSLFREILSHMAEDQGNIAVGMHLLFCAKNIERIGDHATNILETVYFIVTGAQLPPERPKVDESHRASVEAVRAAQVRL